MQLNAGFNAIYCTKRCTKKLPRVIPDHIKHNFECISQPNDYAQLAWELEQDRTLPVLVVSDDCLWTVDYDLNGNRVSAQNSDQTSILLAKNAHDPAH